LEQQFSFQSFYMLSVIIQLIQGFRSKFQSLLPEQVQKELLIAKAGTVNKADPNPVYPRIIPEK